MNSRSVNFLEYSVEIIIPEGVSFSDLGLTQTPEGNVSFDAEIIRYICKASGIEPALLFETTADNLSNLLVQWYAQARKGGEPADPVMENMFGEVLHELAAGQPTSMPPGRT